MASAAGSRPVHGGTGRSDTRSASLPAVASRQIRVRSAGPTAASTVTGGHSTNYGSEQLPADEAALGEALTEDGGEEPEVIEVYELPFTVEAPPTTAPPTTTPAQPVAPPAVPVPAQPNFTG